MLGLPKGQVFLVPWTEQWEVEFTEEAMKIRNELMGDMISIHHIGSTAIKGLHAKPILDIAIEVESFEKGDRCIPGWESWVTPIKEPMYYRIGTISVKANLELTKFICTRPGVNIYISSCCSGTI